MTTRERLAATQHSIWAYWMRYMFSVGQFLADGSWLMPAEKAERWQRQMNTDFSDLSEQEKDSDRRQADKILKALVPSKKKQAFQKHSRHYLGKLLDSQLDEKDLLQYRLVATRELAR